MTSKETKIPAGGEGGEDEQPPLMPPTPSRMGNIGGGIGKTAIISFVVTFVVLMLLSFAGGLFFVTKKDFATNMAGALATLAQSQADVVKLKNDVATAVQGIPSIVTTQVNNSIAQTTSQWNNQLTSVSDRVTGAVNSSQTNTTKIAELLTEINTLKSKVSVLETQSQSVATSVASLSTNVTSLVSRVAMLETSTQANGVQVDVSASDGTITLVVTSDKSQYVSFRLIFRPVTDSGFPSVITHSTNFTTVDNMLIYVGTHPPVLVSTNVNLIPEYGYRYTNAQWQITQIAFLTPRTTVTDVSQSKTLTYTIDAYHYDLLVEPIVSALVGTGGSNW